MTNASNEWVCAQCGWHGTTTKSITKGSILIELVLWLMLLLPGLIYSIWRHVSRYKGCPKCASASLIPADSPVGQKLMRDLK